MSADGANTGLYEENTWNFGIKGGATFGFFGDNQTRLGQGSKKGLAGGGYAQYNQKSWLSWRVELWYQQVGASNWANQFGVRQSQLDINEANYGPTVSYSTSSNFTIHQAELPLQVVVRPPVFKKFAPSIYAGYSIAYNFYATDERIETFVNQTELGLRTNSDVTLRNVTNKFKEIEQAINMGIGFTYPITDKSFNLVFDLRYRLGLSQLADGSRFSDPTPSENNATGNLTNTKITDLNTDTIMISVGIEF